MSTPAGPGTGGPPSLSDGEPLLQRWFVIPMLGLVVVGVGVTIWMFSTLLAKEPITVAERRPPGTAQVTHDRGRAVLNDTLETEPGPDCADRIELFGDRGARDTASAALGATCQLLASGDFPLAEAGLAAWVAGAGQLRVAVFELTGVESSARVERMSELTGERMSELTGEPSGADAPPDDPERIVVELNPRFQFEAGFRAAPMLVHELTHLGMAWPGTPVSAEAELEAMTAQHRACRLLSFRDEPPRGCLDAGLLVEDPDAIEELVAAGYGRGS